MILIAAGSNLPFCGVDSQDLVLHSFSAIGRFADIVAQSPLYESPAWPNAADPPFVNAVLRIDTDIPPATLLAALHAVEAAFGRTRSARNAPRTLDLDLIAYGDVVSTAPVLPHPRALSRAFVLAPLADIAPDWRPPGSRHTVAALCDSLADRAVKRLK